MILGRRRITKKNRIASLDVLRAIALFMICFYHWFAYRGTYVGVVIFFALSGYLFTSKQLINTNVLDIFNATKRRITKIYPSLLTVILVSTIITLIINKGLESTYKQSVIASIFAYNNFYQIFSKLSYFDNFGMLLPLTHIWALSLQFQLYLVVPFLVLLMKKLNFNNKKISVVFFGLSFISAIIMAVNFGIGTDLSKIYYDFSTRAFTFFVASAVAVYFHKKRITKKEKKTIRILGILGLLTILHYSLAIDYTSPANYYGYMYIVSILFSFTILQFSRVDAKFFENKKIKLILHPILKLGQHQYQYYLWQYPIMLFTREIFKWSKLSFLQQFFLQLIVLILVSETTYQLFENGKITGIIKDFWKEKVELRYKKKIFRNEKLKKFIFNYNLIFIIITALILLFSPVYENNDLREMKSIQKGDIVEQKPKLTETQAKRVNTLVLLEQLKQAKNGKVTAKQNLDEHERIYGQLPSDGRNVLFIGDSVLEMAKNGLKEKYPNSIIDTHVGRQFKELPKLLEQYGKEGKIGEIVVVALGTNGAIFKKDMEKSLEMLRGKKVFLINVVVPHSWEKRVNVELKKTVDANVNVRLIDWYEAAKGEKEYFYNDGAHPKPQAVKKYIDMIYSALSED